MPKYPITSLNTHHRGVVKRVRVHGINFRQTEDDGDKQYPSTGDETVGVTVSESVSKSSQDHL